MRIEINAGSIVDFEFKMSSYISQKEDVISAFKAVKNQTLNLNGGVGSLRDAAGNIDSRIQREERHLESAKRVAKTIDDFLSLTIRVDKEVASLVKKNKEEFYNVHPWLRPPESSGSNPVEQFFNWLWNKGAEVVEGIKSAWESLKSFFSAAIEAIKEFYEEHKALFDALFVLGAALVTIAIIGLSGGTALVPLLAAMGCSTALATTISTAVAVVAVVTTAASAVMEALEIAFGVDGTLFQIVKNTLSVFSLITTGAYSVGSGFAKLRIGKMFTGSISIISAISKKIKFEIKTIKWILDVEWIKERLKSISKIVPIVRKLNTDGG